MSGGEGLGGGGKGGGGQGVRRHRRHDQDEVDLADHVGTRTGVNRKPACGAVLHAGGSRACALTPRLDPREALASRMSKRQSA